ncbi:aldo/keto reductase [Arthrobacter crystallopoietes]|uniref:Predicted oxidoreductase n=1 Tax=Crystallibacter crystallopoietes TaxID=37928 RepID=A0A1H1FWC9_9MICC|nr:aldo/keto reductase [Arthrobacter crystallopoietes]AUI52882.1 hypothetical protein AC20117_20900 [Arthrobacter crystallopoietes]SDR05303.1 Predicted oxidoreductase [Arthrobacter crystallopoietes]
MQKKLLGQTGLFVSELGFGAGGYWGFTAFPEKKAAALIDIALEHGINLFDTGPNYSAGNAETRLGRILKERSAEPVVATKVGTRFVDGRHIKDFTPDGIEKSIVSSLRNLQLERLPLVHFHGFPRPAEPAIDKLLDLKDRDLIGHIGVSANGSGARKTVDMDVFNSLMIEYNVINRAGPAKIIDTAGSRGMGVLVKSPLAQTLFSNDIFKIRRRSDIWYLLRAMKNHRSKFTRGRSYRFLNHIDGMTGSEAALNFVLANPHVTSAITGTVDAQHLVSNIEAAGKGLPPELLKRIESTG